MILTAQALTTLLPVLYLLAAGFYGMELGGPRAPHPRRTRHAVSTVLLITHVSWMLVTWRSLGHFPVVDLWTTLSFLALSLLLVYLPLEWFTGLSTTGAFVLGFAFCVQLLASCFTQPLHESELGRSTFFAVHVTTIVLAVAALLLSGFFGGLYLLLLGQIRRGQFGVFFRRLPDLESLSRLNRGAASLGFVLLTVGLNVGIWWAHSGAVAKLDYLDPKVLPVLLLWVVFGLIASSRWLRFLSGRRAAGMAVVAASLLIITVIVSFLPLGSIHES